MEACPAGTLANWNEPSLRIRRPRGAIESHLGIAHVISRYGVKHPTLHGARAGLSVNEDGCKQPSENDTKRGRQEPAQSSER